MALVTSAPADPVDFYLVLDKSGSMAGQRWGELSGVVDVLATVNGAMSPVEATRSRPPVRLVLLHGLNSSSVIWDPLSKAWAARLGWVDGGTFKISRDGAVAWTPRRAPVSGGCGCSGDFYKVDIVAQDDQDLAENSAQLGKVLDALRGCDPSDSRPLLLIGHSLGGLVARAYLVNWNREAAGVAGIVTVGTPHLGSPFAWLSHTSFEDAVVRHLRAQGGGRLSEAVLASAARDADDFVGVLGGVERVAQAFGKQVAFNPKVRAVRSMLPPEEGNELGRLNAEWKGLVDKEMGRAGSAWSQMVFGEVVSTKVTGAESSARFWNTVWSSALIQAYAQRSFCYTSEMPPTLSERMLSFSDGVVPLLSQRFSFHLPRDLGPRQAQIQLDDVSHLAQTDQVDAIAGLVDRLLGAVPSRGSKAAGIGIVAFDQQAKSWRVPAGQSPGIAEISPSGGTSIAQGLAEVMRDVGPEVLSSRPVLLISDGADGDRESVLIQAGNLRRRGAEVSALALGGDADATLLEEVARLGGGSVFRRGAEDLLEVMTGWLAYRRGWRVMQSGPEPVRGRGWTLPPSAMAPSAPRLVLVRGGRGLILEGAGSQGYAWIPLQEGNGLMLGMLRPLAAGLLPVTLRVDQVGSVPASITVFSTEEGVRVEPIAHREIGKPLDVRVGALPGLSLEVGGIDGSKARLLPQDDGFGRCRFVIPAQTAEGRIQLTFRVPTGVAATMLLELARPGSGSMMGIRMALDQLVGQAEARAASTGTFADYRNAVSMHMARRAILGLNGVMPTLQWSSWKRQINPLVDELGTVFAPLLNQGIAERIQIEHGGQVAMRPLGTKPLASSPGRTSSVTLAVDSNGDAQLLVLVGDVVIQLHVSGSSTRLVDGHLQWMRQRSVATGGQASLFRPTDWMFTLGEVASRIESIRSRSEGSTWKPDPTFGGMLEGFQWQCREPNGSLWSGSGGAWMDSAGVRSIPVNLRRGPGQFLITASPEASRKGP